MADEWILESNMQNRFQLAYLLTWALHAALFEPRTASTYFTTHISWDDEALWFQMDKTRQKFVQLISPMFSNKLSFGRFLVSVSDHWTYFIFKVLVSNCCRHKCYQAIERIFESNFWRVFAFWNHCARRGQPLRQTCICPQLVDSIELHSVMRTKNIFARNISKVK